ncbi:methyltransferase, FxLD system [Nonomuraea endophytica]|uniref:methyltransferase, FxLD system n=1 Tax=Nonomuraea endophytica TaxID=714136 RepID=UPI0037CAA907
MTNTVRENSNTQDPVELRNRLVEQIIARHQQLGVVLAPEVEAALRAVPRHLFTPGAPLDQAYANTAVITKRAERGTALSSVSAPTVIAMMLGLLNVQPGQRVLELGSGGYNASLLRELVGPDGSVTSLDIDPDVVQRARECLAAAGYDDVRVRLGDGEFGWAPDAPFDRIIATAGAWDLPPAWLEQLSAGGRLVVPLRTRGMTRAWALERAEGHLASHGHMMCGFVPFQGAGGHQGHSVPLHGQEVGLWIDEERAPDVEALRGVLEQPRAEAWSGVTVARGVAFSDLELWLAASLPGFGVLTAQPEAIERGLVAPGWAHGTAAVIEGGTLAYRAKLRAVPDPDSGQDLNEFGAYAHGPDAEGAAARLAEEIHRWDELGRPAPRLSVHPADTPAAELPSGFVLHKRHTTMVLSGPDHAG